MTISPAVSRLIGDQYAQLAGESLGLAVFGEPVMDLSRSDLVLLVAWLFRRLRAADRDLGSALPAGQPSAN